MGAPDVGTSHRGGPGAVTTHWPQNLRYGARMKRSLPKLTVRRETIRALAAMEITRAAGGNTALTITCKVVCNTGLVAQPPDEFWRDVTRESPLD